MSRFGWAYVDCEPQGSATGPTGSVQFLTGAGFTSGTADFMFYTSSATGPAGQTYSSNTLALTGTLIVRGIISASHYHIENVAEMDSTGSTSFGNTNDDSHARTCSLSVIRENGTVVLNADNSTETTTVRALKVLYSEVTNTKITASVPNYILGISRTGSVEIALPAAST